MGGGYSWKTSQYGLTSDNIAAFELVLPNGTISMVTSDNDDLYFALRGGFNNFVCLGVPFPGVLRLTELSGHSHKL